MNILIGVNNWDVGGAENFVFDLVKNLSIGGHQVSLFIMYDHGFYKDKLEHIFGDQAKKITIVNRQAPSKSLDTVLWYLNGFGNKIGVSGLREKAISKMSSRAINSYIEKAEIDVVNTHLFETDEFISLNTNIPQVVSMHGPYETYLDSNNQYGTTNSDGLNIQFIKRAAHVLSKSKNIIYVADKNLGICRHFDSTGIIKEKIYYGYSKLSDGEIHNKPKNDAFTFGMVARGVEAKGWEVAIESFLELDKNTDLEIKLQLLYTESDYMQGLKDTHAAARNIEFMGFVEGKAKQAYQRRFDVTLLPSYDDCLPVSIIESIMLQIPVISTQVGEIPQMLSVDDKPAGVVLPLSADNGKPVVLDVRNAMQSYIEDKELYKYHKMNTAACSKKFSMKNCIASYEKAYDTAKTEFQARA